MMWVSMRDDTAAQRAREQVTTPVPVVAQTKPLVAVNQVEASVHEVTARFSGKLRPWETYTLGFEQPGRIVTLGTDEKGQPLDDGSRGRSWSGARPSRRSRPSRASGRGIGQFGASL